MYLDTASINEIKKASELGIIKGITTNPTILYKEGKPRALVAKEILEIIDTILYIQVVGTTYEEMMKDYKEIIKISNKNIGIKVPATFDGIKVIKEIRRQNKDIKILGTAIYSSEQSLICGLAGCDFIAPYINRMENNSINSMEVIRKIRKIYDSNNIKTEILAASFKNTSQVINAYENGAHTVTIPMDILDSMINNKLAIDAVEVFNEDYYKLTNKYI